MSIDELCALPVADLAATDSALFLWATFPQLPEALRLIREWGFTYKSVAFVRQIPPGWDVWGNEVQSTLRDFGTICPKEGG